MPASYPTSSKSFTTKSNGGTIDASHVNDLQLEVTAIEDDLLAAFTGGGADGGQMVFPATQNASTSANTLDDYEEGTWTPVIGGSGGTSGQTYAIQVGRYIKIGQLVIAFFNCQFSAKGTITTNVQIQGLPFTALNVTNGFGFAHVEWASLATNWVYISAEVNPNATTATVVGTQAAAASLVNLTTADLDDNAQILGVAIYRADA